MDDLVRWLGEQLDAQEARVRALPGGPWRWEKLDDPVADELAGPDGMVLVSGDADGYSSWIDRHEAFDAYLPDIDPARVLREIDAKRRIVGDLAKVIGGEYIDDGEPVLAEHVLRLLALPYADRPGYREEWRP